MEVVENKGANLQGRKRRATRQWGMAENRIVCYSKIYFLLTFICKLFQENEDREREKAEKSKTEEKRFNADDRRGTEDTEHRGHGERKAENEKGRGMRSEPLRVAPALLRSRGRGYLWPPPECVMRAMMSRRLSVTVEP